MCNANSLNESLVCSISQLTKVTLLTTAQVTITSSCAGLSLKQTILSGIMFSTNNSDYSYGSGGDYFYLDNMDCQWNIDSNSNMKVEVTFFYFNTQPNADYLYVYDGDSSSSSLIGQFSGTSLPAPITSSSNKLYLRFTSDSSVPARGFTAAYRGRMHLSQKALYLR